MMTLRHPPTRTVLVFFLLLGGLLHSPAAGQKPPTAIMTDMRGLAFADRVEYTVFITGIFQYVQSESGRPRRLILDLEPVENRWAPSELAGLPIGVQAVRVAQVKPRTVRVEFELAADGPAYGVKLTGDGLKVVFFKSEKTVQVTPPPGHPAVEQPSAQPAAAKARAVPPRAARPPAGSDFLARGLPSILVGGSVAFHSLSDPRFVEVFGDGSGRSYGLDFALVLLPRSRVRPAIGLDYHRLAKSGVSTISQTPTELILEPITISGLILYETRPVVPYIGVGVCFTNYRELSDLHNTDGSAAGVAIQAGLLVHFGRQNVFKMKVFGRWSSVTALENGGELDLGGTAFGLTALFGFL